MAAKKKAVFSMETSSAFYFHDNSMYFTRLRLTDKYFSICLIGELKRIEKRMPPKILSVNFEVFGRVQGVFFRKCTQEKANSLGLKGWCMNTDSGTVKGTMEGDPEKVEEMKKWLRTTGSPQSRIDNATFTSETEIDKHNYSDFSIKR